MNKNIDVILFICLISLTWLRALFPHLQCERLTGGLLKIKEAREQLDVLNEKLVVQKSAVKEKTDACEILLQDISERTSVANEKKQLAVSKGKDIEEQSVIIVEEKVRHFNFRFILPSSLSELYY